MKIEIRSNSVHISGYVNAVERDSRVLPPAMASEATRDFVEQVASGAFSRAISRRADIKLKFNHGRDIGSTAGKTLTLKEDNIGLHADADITDSEVIKAAKKGELRGWSFGFCNPKSDWEQYRDGVDRRRLKDFDLLEVSILTDTPAYIGTSVEMRGDECSTFETRGCDDKPEVITTEEEGKPAEIPPYSKQIEVLKLKRL